MCCVLASIVAHGEESLTPLPITSLPSLSLHCTLPGSHSIFTILAGFRENLLCALQHCLFYYHVWDLLDLCASGY